MTDSSRRSFIGLGATGFVALAASTQAFAETPGPITVRQTAGEMRYAEQPAPAWHAKQPVAPHAVVVDTSKFYQEMLGFGAALTDASAYMINQLTPEAREQFLHELFTPSELGIGVLRICVGSSDYSTEMFSYDEGEPDPELKRFSIDHDRAYLIPQLLAARKNNPELFILASPWSPPGWMKNGGTMLGGNLKPDNFPVYSKYLLKFLQAYKDAGISVDAITSQNETDTEQAGRMPACAWAQEHEVVFVGKYLGLGIAEANLKTKIWILDHNFNLWGRVYNTLEDPDVMKYVDGVAWHPYVGSVTAITRTHDAYPEIHQYVTEGEFELTADLTGPIRFAATPGPMTDTGASETEGHPRRKADPVIEISRGGQGAANAVRNWARCFINWNIVLDENGKPNIGPFHGPGMITIDSHTKEITRGANYWVMKHYCAAARRGARVVDSTGSIPDLTHVAFVDPDGRKTVVLSNTSATSRTVQLHIGSAAADIIVPRHSVTNLSWT